MSNRLHDNYMSDIAHVAIMTDAEEKALALEIEKGSQEALNRLVGANLRYVVTLANTYKNCGLETEDLISEGNIGLMKAAAKFRADHNKRFAPSPLPISDRASRRPSLATTAMPTRPTASGCTRWTPPYRWAARTHTRC